VESTPIYNVIAGASFLRSHILEFNRSRFAGAARFITSGFLFSCTDAAYWEVYAKDEATLCLVKEVFPDAEECSLGEK
jgi:hypothetical protein